MEEKYDILPCEQI